MDEWTSLMRVASARIGVVYRWKDQLRARVAYEATPGGGLRDAYVQLAPCACLQIRAGRFKLPISAIEGTSTWTLPTVDRGIVAEVLDDGIALTGRRDAIGVDWKPPGVVSPRVELAMSQYKPRFEYPLGLERTLASGAGLAATVRVSAKPVPGVEVGAVGSVRSADHEPDSFLRYWAGGIDVTVDRDDLGIRAWADVLVGTSPLAGERKTAFLAAQLIAAWRRGGADRGKPYVEPFASFGIFNPDLDRKADVIAEGAAGISAGRWRRWRVQAQLSYRRSYTDLLVLGPTTAPFSQVGDRTAIVIQLGAAF